MTTIRLTLDVATLRDNNKDAFCNPEVSINLLGQEIMVELSNIPMDQSGEVNRLNDRIYDLEADLREVRLDRQESDYWREQYNASRRELFVLEMKHAPEDLKALVRAYSDRPIPSKIDAIKAVRENTSWGLKESKDFVDMVWGTPAPVAATV